LCDFNIFTSYLTSRYGWNMHFIFYILTSRYDWNIKKDGVKDTNNSIDNTCTYGEFS